jgi:heterodisulfide reductase subunit A-like polyferredoxin
MVVGGGVSGMQASLDLANAGYKVYLVEKDSAIGGHMAQLDKTFPTNDCAMCTISPRLVEVGRHLNIEILTQTELESLSGEPGNFKARVRSRPRFVDPNACTACGDCSKACPEPLASLFDEGLIDQRAAYKRYPQAIPSAYAIEKTGTAPCRDACPIDQRAQGYIALIREGRIEDAMRTIKQENPFPAICGRICDHRCETACSRGKVDEPLSIRALKRFVTDTVYAQPRVAPEPVSRAYEERVAVIGAGPCGLTAAQDLCRQGYGVTVFEALPVAGGMLRVGVPEFRLAAETIDREVQDILDLGVELRLETRVERLDDLFESGYAAVLVASGAHEGIRLPIPGNDLDGVIINTDFLRDVRLAQHAAQAGSDDAAAQAPTSDPRGAVEGKRVVVLGGGDVAMDVARTALRLGATEAHVACLESRDAMRAQPAEVAGALEEGVVLHNDRVPVRVEDDGAGRVAGLTCQRVTSFSFGEGGRLSVETEPDSEHTLAADVMIFSVGQRVALPFLDDDAGVGLTPQRTVSVDSETFATSRPGVFAAGDSVTGTSFVVKAIAAGQRAARSIHRHLRGEEAEAPPAEAPVAAQAQEELDAQVHSGKLARQLRVPLPETPVSERMDHFDEFETGYSLEQARAEAARCLSCGVCSECLMCVEACGVKAIDHEMRETERELDVGAVILAPGYQVYRAELSEEFGMGRFPNVVTSMQFERLLSASGPTLGHVERPSDGRTPKKIAFLQCVGSRDQTHDYCSSVCCMYAAKEAIMAIEHEPDTEVHVFMMDTRSFSKGYDSYYRRAREKYGIQYRRCRISSVKENRDNGNLRLKYVESWATGDEASAFPTPVVSEDEFDMVVLSVGMEISENVRDLGKRLGVELDDYGFCSTVQYDPLQTSRPGIYACGPFREPKDIPDSLVEASGAAAAAGELLAPARGTLTREAEYPEERDVSEEDPRVAVFVCHCGSNIAGTVDVSKVTDYAKTLPGVVHAEHTLYTCSQDGIANITQQVKEHGANRVVVASCTPMTHEGLFQDSIRAAGLNPYLFDMANIRNQCSWVHSENKDGATDKAKQLVRMSAARCGQLRALSSSDLSLTQSALVVGGGPAGMVAALSLANQGFPVHLVEKGEVLGGNLRNLHFGLDAMGVGAGLKPSGKTEFLEPREYLEELVAQVNEHPQIEVHLGTELARARGFVGNFVSTLQPVERKTNGGNGGAAEAEDGDAQADAIEVSHGVIILATGGVEYRGDEYGYGTARNIVTQQELEARLAQHAEPAEGETPAPLPRSVVMIQCVGPAERYCARICCTSALKNAMVLKRLDPSIQITVIYRDIRTYGFKERLYTQAREQGVVFVHYDDARLPEVSVAGAEGEAVAERDAALEVRVWDEALAREVVLSPELLVLSTPVVPAMAAQEMRNRLKVQLDSDGFYLEAHVKLRPVDFVSEGIFMAGMAHYPKLLEESIAHARAAAARAATVLGRDSIHTGGRVADVDQELCVGCLTCVRACPFGAVRIRDEAFGVGGVQGAAGVEAALCQGCGTCAAECPAGAIDLLHYTDTQVMTKVDALFETAEGEAP